MVRYSSRRFFFHTFADVLHLRGFFWRLPVAMNGGGEVSSCTAHITTTTRAHVCPIHPHIPCHLLHTRTHTPLFVQLTPSNTHASN